MVISAGSCDALTRQRIGGNMYIQILYTNIQYLCTIFVCIYFCNSQEYTRKCKNMKRVVYSFIYYFVVVVLNIITHKFGLREKEIYVVK